MRKGPHPINRKLCLIHNAFKEQRNRRLLRYDLTSSQMDVMVFLHLNQGKVIYQKEIEKWLQLKNPTVTGILNRLEEKGFISRTTNEQDKRYRRIALTEKGIAVLEEIGDELVSRDKKLYSCMTEEEREKMEELLDRILHNLKESEEKEC